MSFKICFLIYFLAIFPYLGYSRSVDFNYKWIDIHEQGHPVSPPLIRLTTNTILADVIRVKRGFFKKFWKSTEKSFHKVRDAALPAAGAALGAGVLG